ncbi:unnamed protein product [Mesocestoides corti]|uniref:Large ribosomal subunit protein mL50 n=1 Tax=Mesocestoides corti TaxID=53468 RepID=A0A0R3UFN7_MESCO|nr:unnamed protein product [Mesocestoides corti]
MPPYRVPKDVESRLESVARRCLLKFKNLSEPYKFPDRGSKVKFLKACMQEFNHAIPSNVLHELDDVDSVRKYFSVNVEPEDKLVAMLDDHFAANSLPSNLVIQVDSIRCDPEDKSFFSTTPFPGRSTIVSGLSSSKKYPSRKVSKDRRLWIDAEDIA